MSIDADYHKRLEWLADLMEKFPGKKMRRLQQEAMNMYPISSVEGRRNWLSIRVGFLASNICNKRLIDQMEEESNADNS